MISVVIPTCNRNEYLKESINNVINQSILPKEIIIINNGKKKIEESLYNLSELIKIIDIMPYAGVAQARNIGVILSKTKYVAFLDDDDLWEVDYIKKILNIIHESAADMIVTKVDQLVGGKVESFKDSSFFPTLEDVLMFNPGYVGSSIVVKRKSFIEIGGFDVKLTTSEDNDLAINMMFNNYVIKHCSHIQSILRQHDGERLSNHKTIVKGITAFYEKHYEIMSAKVRAFNRFKLYKSKWYLKKNPLFLIMVLINGLIYFLLKVKRISK